MEEDSRVVSVVSDETDNEEEFGSVHRIRIIPGETVDADPFSKSAEAVRQMAGFDSNFKRKVTNELKKVRRGEDGAESKQVETKELGVLSGYNILDVVHPEYNLDYLARLYELSPHHHAAVDAKVANIVGLGYRFVESPFIKRKFEENADNEKKVKKARQGLEQHKEELEEKFENFNEEDSLLEILIKVWRDYEVTGNGYLEVGRKKTGEIGYIGHIPAQTMRIRKKRDGFVQMAGDKVQFFGNFGDGWDKENQKPQTVSNPIGGGKPNEVIHIKRYSPTSGFYGIPDIIAAKQAVAGNEFAYRFNLDYFENKAVPRHVVVLKGAKLGSQQMQSLLEFFETGLKGQHHRSLFIPLPAGTKEKPVEFDIKPVESGVQDASFVNYRKANVTDILMAHRVPLTKVSVSENVALALAKDADKTFKEQVCAPEQRIFEKKFNKIMRELTNSLVFSLNEMTLTDEDTQSKIDERNVKAGIDLPNEVRTRKGLPGVQGGNERVDLNAKDKIARQSAEATANRQRDATRSANSTDSSGNARNPKGEGRTTP